MTAGTQDCLRGPHGLSTGPGTAPAGIERMSKCMYSGRFEQGSVAGKRGFDLAPTPLELPGSSLLTVKQGLPSAELLFSPVGSEMPPTPV